MEQKILDDSVMSQYLLGLLSDEEREQVEALFFENESVFDQLTMFEDDLIDNYVKGRLSASFQQAFEKKLSSDPHWKQRVAFAKALASRVSEPELRAALMPTRSRSVFQILLDAFRTQGGGFQFAMVAASLIVVIGIAGLTWQLVQQRANLQSAQTERQDLEKAVEDLKDQVAGLQKQGQDLNRELEQERLRRQELETSRPNDSSALGLMASFILRAGIVRGANDATQLTIPPAARTVRLQLELNPGDDYPSYRAELRTTKGITVLTRDTLKARANAGSQTISFDLPAQSLTAGGYELSLLGRPEGGKPEQIAYYYFNVP